MSKNISAAQYLGITNSVATSKTPRERGIVKTGPKSKKDGYKESEDLDTTITWFDIIYRDLKPFTYKPCPNCGTLHIIRTYET